jgi:hypothetical protein
VEIFIIIGLIITLLSIEVTLRKIHKTNTEILEELRKSNEG